MAIIEKKIIVCNKCGADTDNKTSNLVVMNEQFCLCDKCMATVLDYITSGAELPVTEKVKPKMPIVMPEPRKKPNIRMTWDEYSVNRVLKMYETGMLMKDIAKNLSISPSAVYTVFKAIRSAKPGHHLQEFQHSLKKAKEIRNKGGKKS